MPNLWSYAFGGETGTASSSNGGGGGSKSGSKPNSSDNLTRNEDEDSYSASPVAHNPLIPSNVKSSSVGNGGVPKSLVVPTTGANAAAYKKNDSFNSAKDLLPAEGKSTTGSGVKSLSNTSSGGNSRGSPAPSGGQLKQRKDFVGDVESSAYP